VDDLSTLIDIESVATRLGISERHVRRLVAERPFPYVKIGRFVRFDPVDIADWISACRVPARLLSHPFLLIDAERGSRIRRASDSVSRP
jgi:excisionase family DNA binding protein